MTIERESDLALWAASFRSAAKANGNARFLEHLDRVDAQVDPAEPLEATIDFVTAAVAMAGLDGRQIGSFLDLQTYDPPDVPNATYVVTFDVFGRGVARLIVDAELRVLDLADLYGMPWYRYERVGYSRFWISRIDGADLSSAELERLEHSVTEDLRFDYSEDELEVWFDADSCRGAMLVTLQDRVEPDE